MYAFNCFLFISGIVIPALADEPPVDCLNPPNTFDKCDKLVQATMATENPLARKVSFNTAYQMFCASILQRECGATTVFYEDRSNGETRLEIKMLVGGKMKNLYMYTELGADEQSCTLMPSQVTQAHCVSWLQRVSPSTNRNSVSLISARQYVCLQALAASCGVDLDSEAPPFNLKQESQMVEIKLTPSLQPRGRANLPPSPIPQIVHIARPIAHRPCVSWDSKDKSGCLQWLIQSQMTTDQQIVTMTDELVCFQRVGLNCGAKIKGYLDSSNDQDNHLVKMVLDFSEPKVFESNAFYAQDHYGYTFLDSWKKFIGYQLENDPQREYLK